MSTNTPPKIVDWAIHNSQFSPPSPYLLLTAYCLLLTAYSLLSVSPTSAHGGGIIQLAAVPAGPYQLTVWMNPGTAQAGRATHITVAVANGVDQSAVLDAAVHVEVWSRESGVQLLSTPATTEQSTNKLFYKTDFILPETGPIAVRVLVNGTAGEGQAEFTTNVQKPTNNVWLAAFPLSAAVLAAVIIYHTWRSRSPVVVRRPSRQARND